MTGTSSPTASDIWTSAFWAATVERGLRTAAQAAVLTLTAGALNAGGVDAFDAFDVNWFHVLSFAVGGFVLAVLTSLTVHAVGGNGPAITDTEVLTPPVQGPSDATPTTG